MACISARQGRGLLFEIAALGCIFWASLAYGQITPSGFQITDRDAANQIKVKLVDYAVAPNTAPGVGEEKTALQVARINFIRQDPTNSSRFVVNDLNGPLYTLNKTTGVFSPYVDFNTIFPDFDINPGFAAGLTTFQFDPGFANLSSPGYGTFYTTHTENTGGGSFRVAVLNRWKVPGDPISNFGNPAQAPTPTELLRVDYGSNVHPLGDIAFNPNAQPGNPDYRMMYVSGGDGAAGETIGSSATRNMPQMLNNYLGKVLRIQPDDPDGNGPLVYGIPSDNPYASATFTNAGAKGEVWAYGFRNPHRMEFDAPSGKLIVNDIGLNGYEEVNIVNKGANYGYAKLEGNQVLPSNSNTVSTSALPSSLPVWVSSTSSAFNGLTIVPTYPVAQFSHADGDAIPSGYVYRGTKLPALVGKYIFGDITSARLFYVDYSQLLAQNSENSGTGNPATMPSLHELQAMYNGNEIRVFDLVRDTFDLRNETVFGSTVLTGDDDNDRLPGSADATNGNDPYGIAYRQPGDSQGGRADIRWAIGPDDELYLISKSDGMIRALVHPGDYNGVFGDFNFDGQFTVVDVQAMSNALANLDAFKSVHILADADLVAMGDFNRDGMFTSADIQAVPEPTTPILTVVGLAAVLAVRFRK
jgi:hypothetical protein